MLQGDSQTESKSCINRATMVVQMMETSVIDLFFHFSISGNESFILSLKLRLSNPNGCCSASLRLSNPNGCCSASIVGFSGDGFIVQWILCLKTVTAYDLTGGGSDGFPQYIC